MMKLMNSKTKQSILINLLVNYFPYHGDHFKCRNSTKSISFKSYNLILISANCFAIVDHVLVYVDPARHEN